MSKPTYGNPIGCTHTSAFFWFQHSRPNGFARQRHEKGHAQAHAVCGMLEEECSKKDTDHVMCAQCCSDMWHELDAAKADTDKLFKMLKIANLEPPAKKVGIAKKGAVKPDESQK